MFNKIHEFPLTKEGIDLAFMPSHKRYLLLCERWLSEPENFKKALSVVSLLIFVTNTSIVLAGGPNIDTSMKRFIAIAQKGIKYLSMMTVFYGLYVKLIKRDDTGKKVAVGAIVVFVCSLLVPWAYDLIEGIFS